MVWLILSSITPHRLITPRVLFNPQLMLGASRNHALIPRRIPNQLHLNFAYARHCEQPFSDILFEKLPHAATLRGQGKAHGRCVSGYELDPFSARDHDRSAITG